MPIYFNMADYYDYDDILALPCYAKEDVPSNTFITYPGVQFKNEYCDEYRILSNENLLGFMKRIHHYRERCPISREIFLQFVIHYMNGRWPTEGGHLPIYNLEKVEGIQQVLSQALYCLVPDRISDFKSLKMKGKFLWCLKVDFDRYLSLADTGVRIASSEEWIFYMKERLLHTTDGPEEIIKNLIRGNWNMIPLK